MSLLGTMASSGFQNAVFVYIAASVLSFAAGASLFVRRRREVARHTPAALVLASAVGAMQLLVIAALAQVSDRSFEADYFRDVLSATAIVLLPAFFISTFVMAATGAWLSEKEKTPPFPVANGLWRRKAGTLRAAAERIGIALVAGGVALIYSIGLFWGCQQLTGSPPQPAPGTEEVAEIFAGNIPLVLGFGLAAAFWEEIFVRLFLLNALRRLFRGARFSTVCAVLLSSAIWAAGHAGTMNPEIIKFMQVFVVGILFGIIHVKKGIETCLGAHSAFNVGILVLGGFQ